MSQSKRQIFSSFFNDLLDREQRGQELAEFDKQLPEQRSKIKTQNHEEDNRKQSEISSNKNMRKLKHESLEEYKERKRREREQREEQKRIKNKNLQQISYAKKMGEKKKIRRNEKQSMVYNLNKLISGIQERNQLQSVSSFHSEKSQDIKDNPRRFFSKEINKIIQRQINPEYESSINDKKSQKKTQKVEKKQVKLKEQEVLKEEKVEKSKIRRSIFQLIEQGVKGQDYALESEKDVQKQENIFVEKQEKQEKIFKKKIKEKDESKKQKQRTPYKNRSITPTKNRSLTPPKINKKNEKKQKQIEESKLITPESKLRKKELTPEIKKRRNTTPENKNYKESNRKDQSIKFPTINKKPKVQYKNEESTIISTTIQNYPTHPLYKPVTEKHLNKAQTSSSKTRIKGKYDEHQLANIKIDNNVLKYSIEEAIKREKFKYLKRE